MLKFSGYPYLIRGQPYERFNGRDRPRSEAINEITTLRDGQLSRKTLRRAENRDAQYQARLEW